MANQITRAIATTFALWLAFGCAYSQQEPVATGRRPLDAAVRQKVLNATLEIVPETVARSSTVGTAFSIGNGEFATAAHVLENFIGSAYPRPVFRAANGKIYPVDRVVQFTNEGDGEFAVVTLKGAPSIEPLRTTDTLSRGGSHWFAGRRSGGGIDIEEATVLSASSKTIDFEGPVTEGFSGGPLFDRNGAVLGLITRGDPLAKWGRTTLMIALEDAEPTLQVHASALIEALGAGRSPKIVDPESLAVASSFEAFSSALITARKVLYRRILFDPKEPRTKRFVFLGPQSPAVCELLNGTKCVDVTGETAAGAETWSLPDESETQQRPLAPTLGALPVYNIHGAILIRDGAQPKTVASLRRRAEIHLKLARRCFEDPLLRIRLASSYEPLQKKTALPPKTQDYPDTQGRTWTLRTWKLEDEDFFIVSLGRETNDGLAHIVLATVVPESRVDGATVLLKYIANFTLSASGGVMPSSAVKRR